MVFNVHQTCLQHFNILVVSVLSISSTQNNSSTFIAYPVVANVLLTGHHDVKHELIFVESDLLTNNRVIAAPTMGWVEGVVEIEAGKPLRFSWLTRIYVVPTGAQIPEAVDDDLMAQWPSCKPPVRHFKSAPLYSPVVSAISSCKLVEINQKEVKIELIEHTLLDSTGAEANIWPPILALFGISAIGFAGCFAICWRRYRRKKLFRTTMDNAYSD